MEESWTLGLPYAGMKVGFWELRNFKQSWIILHASVIIFDHNF